MSIISTAIGQEFIYEFSSLTGTAFQKKCHAYLSMLISDLRYAADLKKVDRKGVDIYQLSASARFDYTVAFQCKGFEERFDKSQLNQCIGSINTLRQSGLKIDRYYLLVNLKSKYFDLSYRRELDMELKKLADDKIVRSAVLLDAEGFTAFISRLIIKKMHQQINLANKRFARDYVHAMKQQFYLENVPYLLDNKKGMNPSTYVLNKMVDTALNRLRSNKKNWVFVISEFGFGKTSLLFHLFNVLKSHRQRCLYVPASLFQKDDFIYTTKFANQLLKIIEGREVDFTLSYNRLRSRLLHYLLQHENNELILMIDGLDEHEELFNQDILKTFFKHISPFKSPILFTIRKEMWDERHGNFQAALGKGNEKNKVKLFLEEWNNSEILSYLDKYHQSVKGNSSSQKNLNEFRQLVADNRYERFYGDIPRRPLFLEMLISDVRVNKINKRNISEIYTIYLTNKFLLDRHGAFASHSSRRPLSSKEDVNKVTGIILSILSIVATKMIIGVDKENALILASYIEEQKLEGLFAENGISKTIELMLHSVLVPMGIRVNDNMSLKFAHKSFQEFFLARAIFSNLLLHLENKSNPDDLNVIASEGVNRFLIGFLESGISRADYSSIQNMVRRNYNQIIPGSIAGMILKD